MVNLPVIERLDIEGYGLFPGTKTEPGLHLTTLPGLTLILGANGLGKTTIITLLFRLMTGPWDIHALLHSVGSLGTSKLEATEIPGPRKSTFADRVSDGARSASARLEFKLGERLITVERRLRDLQMSRFLIDGILQASDEASFQKKVCELTGVWSFGDWILLLRHIVFYFEDRRALVWDRKAQRQLLRILLLHRDLAHDWALRERDILELDSYMRNLSATVFRESQAVAKAEQQATGAETVRAEIAQLEHLQRCDADLRTKTEESLAETESKRQSARLRRLQAEQARETASRELEHAKLSAIRARYPTSSESAQYILAQLVSSCRCLFCGKQVPEIAEEMEDRISLGRCIVCGSPLNDHHDETEATSVTDDRMHELKRLLSSRQADFQSADNDLSQAEDEYEGLYFERTKLDAAIAERTAQLDALSRLLPHTEAKVQRQRGELELLRAHMAVLKDELEHKREAFSLFLNNKNRTIATKAEEIEASFHRYARGFLLDDCRLVWAVHQEPLGQGGRPMPYFSFEVELGGSNFPSAVRRSGPEQVSESQREFIDLAFRMALTKVATTQSQGSLVIDAPESSLDAVFSKRAAEALASFADPQEGSRLVIASNLVEGKLLHQLVRLCTDSGDRTRRVLNLLEIAEPTSATRQLRGDYDAFVNELLTQRGSDS